MDRSRLINILLSISAVLLGTWLVLGGLELRILGTYLHWHQQIPLLAYPEHLLKVERLGPGSPHSLGWPMVVFGSSWGGALFGFRIGERWSFPAMTVLAGLALLFPYPGTILGFIILLLIFSSRELKSDLTAPTDGT
jgi:hypothetical protein